MGNSDDDGAVLTPNSTIIAAETLTRVQHAFPGVTIPNLERGLLCSICGFLTAGIGRFFIIPQGFMMVVMGFGKYRTFKGPGLNAILSFWGVYQRPWKHLIPSHEQMERFNVVGATTADGLNCDVDAVFSFRIVDPGKAVFEVVDFADIIKTVAIGLVRDECGRRPMPDLLKSRTEMGQGVKRALSTEAELRGLSIPLFDVLEITRDRQGRPAG